MKDFQFRHFTIIAVLFALFFTCFACKQKLEERVEYFETGVVSRRVPFVNGLREGKMVDFYPDSKLMAERWFKAGKQDGKTTIYYPSGAVKEVQYYLNGDQHGGDTLWYEDGKIQFAVFFQHNKKDGYLRKWAPDGSLVFESKYARDTLIEVKGEPISRNTIEARHASDTIIKPSRQQ